MIVPYNILYQQSTSLNIFKIQEKYALIVCSQHHHHHLLFCCNCKALFDDSTRTVQDRYTILKG